MGVKRSRRSELMFKKQRFYLENKTVIDACAVRELAVTTAAVKALVHMARHDVGYSAKTIPADIYSSLLTLTPTYKARKEKWARV